MAAVIKNDAFLVKANYVIDSSGNVTTDSAQYTYSIDGTNFKNLEEISKDVRGVNAGGGKSRNILNSKKRNVRTYRKRRKNINI